MLRPRSLLLSLALLLGACGVRRGVPDGGVLDAAPPDASVEQDAGAPDAGFVACETSSSLAEPRPATLLLTVDTSGSMNCRADDTSCANGEPTADPSDSRYDVFRAVLRGALAELSDGHVVAASHYPVTFSCARDELLVEFARLGDARAPIEAALAGVTPEGITPTHDAVRFGLGRLRARASDEDRYLVLATDGAATVCVGCDAACSFEQLDRDHEAMIDAVRRAAEDEGVRTFVIGVPGSDSYRSVLSRLATAAGTGREGCSDNGPTYCHYDLADPGLDFASALEEALSAIGEAVLSCEYPIPDNPEGTFDPGQVNVVLTLDDGAEQPIGRDPGRQAGWDYSDDGAVIVLHGEACETARANRAGRVEVRFGCPTDLI